MNKTILIAGGTALASLAAGGAGGYLYAKNKLGKEFDERLERELAATKKQYSIMLMDAREKPATPEEVTPVDGDAPRDEVHQDNTDTPREAALRQAGEKALVDYQAASTKNGNHTNGTTVSSNIFTDKRPQRPKRERDPETGRFLPLQAGASNSNEAEPTPYLISEEDFLGDDVDYNKEYLHYFIDNKTLVHSEDYENVVENDIVGEANLTLFPDVEDGEESTIIVRNEVAEVDYEIKRMHGDLAEHMGFGTETDFDENDLAEHALAHSYED